MQCRELSSWDWNGFVVLRCLGSFCWHAHCQFWTSQSFGRFRTGQNLDLWDRVEQFLMSAVMSFALLSFFARHVYGFYAQKPLWSVLQSCEELCMHWQLGVSEFCMLPSVCTISFLSETSKCKWPHITCQDVRHASWGNSECDLYRKCESSIKVWGTHLRMNEREREMDSCFSVMGWVVA